MCHLGKFAGSIRRRKNLGESADCSGTLWLCRTDVLIYTWQAASSSLRFRRQVQTQPTGPVTYIASD
jgi:hypothetical protein